MLFDVLWLITPSPCEGAGGGSDRERGLVKRGRSVVREGRGRGTVGGGEPSKQVGRGQRVRGRCKEGKVNEG